MPHEDGERSKTQQLFALAGIFKRRRIKKARNQKSGYGLGSVDTLN
jgi:hypothetical protein